MLNDLIDSTTHTVRLTSAQLMAVIELLDDHLATTPRPLATGPARTGERLRIMYLEHARGRLRSTLGSARAGVPS